MTDEKTIRAIRGRIFSGGELSTYAVLDGASIPDLLQALCDHRPEHCCLYRGELEPDLAETAPYLVRLDADSRFTDWLLKEGWGNHWGIFAITGTDFRSMRRHFRTFLIVRDPDGKPLYFRYYDPRVLRVYLPTCNAEETTTVFGPIESYVLEGQDPAVLLWFRPEQEAPVREEVMLQSV